MDIYKLKNLLDNVQNLIVHYKKVSQLTGENFNVFKILKLEASEVRLHSAFIAELLNPKGSHGQGDVFLRLFKDLFCFKGNDLDTANCIVETEKHTGLISKSGTEGGRIDILITDANDNRIIIENKIYAGDQKNQLLRYYNFSKEADLIYLTLGGKEPESLSRGELTGDQHYKCYSYKIDIINWLEACRKESAMLPILRESITQYINLLKYLTNQAANHNMEKELQQMLVSNLEASFLIANNLDKALGGILNSFVDDLTNALEARGLVCTSNINLDKNFTGLYIYKPEWEYANISFQFQAYDKKLIYGIAAKKEAEKFPPDLRQVLNTIAVEETAETALWWPWCKNIEAPYDDWGNYDAWKTITDGTMLEMIKDKISYLLGIVDGLKL